tara:strand:- start:1549 stop:1692 length:144 start_codon:yes stop_codon:yes gene_type:complete
MGTNKVEGEYIVCEECQGCVNEECCFLALVCIPYNRKFYEARGSKDK